ncbi:MAG: hypothetical protein HGA85_09450, partial [Nanoarchaeota archaeon]|nr:hypothetical protein [Nanoarchaeota archaeon]
SYQEEIDDLIRKTNPNNKNYHIPISGYNRRREDGPAPAPVAQAAPRVSVPTPALVQEAPVVITELEAPAPKAVYTDVLQDTRALKDLVGEPVESIVIDSPQAPVLSAPLPKEEDEFILNVEPVAEVKAAPVVHAPAPAPVAQAPAERPRPKNPVASCDLSTYFMKH